MIVGLLKDLITEGHESENFWFEKIMDDASPDKQDRFYSGELLTPPHDTNLEKIITLHNLIRRERPSRVLELGVKHGFTTYGILSAISANGTGQLVSIDRNKFAIRGMRTGHLVPDSLKKFWDLKNGDASELLPSLGSFDLILEDFGASLGEEMLMRLWGVLNHSGYLFISSRVTKPVFDSFAQEKGGWLAKAENVRHPIAAWGLLRKL